MELSEKVANIAPSLTLAITAKAKQMKKDGISVVSFGAGNIDACCGALAEKLREKA